MKSFVFAIAIVCIVAMVGCVTAKPSVYDEGVVSGAKALIWLQSKGYTTTNITWEQVLDVGRQLEGKNERVWKALEDAKGK